MVVLSYMCVLKNREHPVYFSSKEHIAIDEPRSKAVPY